MKRNLKNWPPLPLKIYLKFLLMTSPLDSHTKTDVKPEMLSGVQTGNKHNTCGIAHAHRNGKDNIFKKRRLYIYWNPGKGLVH